MRKLKELQLALQEVQQAEQNLNYADETFIDTAIYQLKSAYQKYDSIMFDYRETQIREVN